MEPRRPDPPTALPELEDELERWALAEHVAEVEFLRTPNDDAARHRFLQAGARLRVACRAYEDLTGREIADVRIEPDTELPTLAQVDASLRAAERRDALTGAANVRRKRKQALAEIERARAHGPLRGYHRDLAETWGVPTQAKTPMKSLHVPAADRRSRPRGAGRPRAQASRSSAKSGDSGSDSDDPPAPRRCAASWCDHLVYGPPRQRYCRTERCDQARATERQRTRRANLGDLVAVERARLDDARVAGYVGDEAFGFHGRHALGFLFPGSWEYDALKQRACRCNGRDVDGGCLKCGLLSHREAVA